MWRSWENARNHYAERIQELPVSADAKKDEVRLPPHHSDFTFRNYPRLERLRCYIYVEGKGYKKKWPKNK